MEELGKKLVAIYGAMLQAYRTNRDKEQGTRDALAIYEENDQLISEIRKALGDIDDLKTVLQASIDEIAKQREKQEGTARRIKGSGSFVSKLVPCGKRCRGCPHGPYLYKVIKVNGKLIWEYLGRSS